MHLSLIVTGIIIQLMATLINRAHKLEVIESSDATSEPSAQPTSQPTSEPRPAAEPESEEFQGPDSIEVNGCKHCHY